MIVDTAFGFFLDLSRVIAIHKPMLEINVGRHSISAFAKFRIDGGTHTGFVDYSRNLHESGEARPGKRNWHWNDGEKGPLLPYEIDDWEMLDLLVHTGDGSKEWRRYDPASDDRSQVAGLWRLREEVDALISQWRFASPA